VAPQSGFSPVGLKATAAMQYGKQQTVTDSAKVTSEISGPGAKVGSELQSTYSLQQSQQTSLSAQQDLARVEQYLTARKVGNRAIWRVLAGVGPIDAGGTEYIADLLIPDHVDEFSVHVEVNVEWARSGIVPASVQEKLSLPRPWQVLGGDAEKS
jgi:hypothetical protein